MCRMLLAKLLIHLIICIQIALYLLFGTIFFFPKFLETNKYYNHIAMLEQVNEPIKVEVINQLQVPSTTETFSTTEVSSIPGTSSTTATPSTTETPSANCTAKFCGVCKSETVTEGFISSPNYPEDYGNNRACIYILQVPVDRTIQLSFTVFNIELEYDWIDVYDEVNLKVSSNFTRDTSLTGYEIPETRNSSSNVMTIHFVSDMDNTIIENGLVGRWKAVYKLI